MILFALLSCEPEYNPSIEYVTIEYLISLAEHGQKENITLEYRTMDEEDLKECPHWDKEKIVFPVLKEIKFKKGKTRNGIQVLHSSECIARVSPPGGTKMTLCIFQDFTSAFVTSAGGYYDSFTTCYTIQMEDGKKLYEAIVEGYEKGKAFPHDYYSSCPFDPSDYDYHPKNTGTSSTNP